MEVSTTIKGMISQSYIYVPDYQRAYSWDTPNNHKDGKTQIDIFYKDLEEYIYSGFLGPYYFGHFLYELKTDNKYAVIDGQQRLTTIVIFLASIFNRMRKISILTDEEEELYEDLIERRKKIKFETVKYDNQIYKDCIIYNKDINKDILDTESSKRLIDAYEYFNKKLESKTKNELKLFLKIVINASCTTHIVKNEVEAVQMFIFQNNRGKKPSKLEIIKAQFIYSINLNSKNDNIDLIFEINNRFEKIYSSLTKLENIVTEDEILLFTLKIYYNSLWENNISERITLQLLEKDYEQFILDFSRLLEKNIQYLIRFHTIDQKNNIHIHSLITLGLDSNIYPFILKGYMFNIDKNNFINLCIMLEKILLRSKIISTRADLKSRINDVYKGLKEEDYTVIRVVNLIEEMIKDPDYYWWGYWSKLEFEKSLSEKMNSKISKYILWKYENYLIRLNKGMYSFLEYTSIDSPELEHIAPQNPKDNLCSGYPEYTEEFKNRYLNSIGNYLLISKAHNGSIGNRNLKDKLSSYTYLYQQREVVDMCKKKEKWDKNLIKKREKKIVKFILEYL